MVQILVSGNTLIYVAFYFTLGRRKYRGCKANRKQFIRSSVYSNSVLATLNARQTIRRLGENSDELSFSLQSVSKSGQRNPATAVCILMDLRLRPMLSLY